MSTLLTEPPRHAAPSMGKALSPATAAVAPPFHLTYHDRLVYKVMNQHVGRPPMFTFAQTLDVVRRVHDLTAGLPQIVYLTGWQYGGHDDKYPAFFEVSPALAGEGEEPAAALRDLMREARRYDARVSLHVNLCDAYEDSPLWDEYVAADVICRNGDGSLRKGGVWAGKQSYLISKTREWRAGLLRRRVDRLLALLPIAESQSIHIDVFNAVASPFHGITVADDNATLVEVVRYFRDRGVDVTIEWWKRELAGLVPYAWHFNLDEEDRLAYPPDLVCGGGDAWNGRRDRPSGGEHPWMNSNSPSTGCRYEQAWGRSVDDEPGHEGAPFDAFARQVYERTIPWLYLCQSRPVRYCSDGGRYEVTFASGVTSAVAKADGRHTVRDAGGVAVLDGGDYCLPAPWRGADARLAYSAAGGTRAWPVAAADGDAPRRYRARPLWPGGAAPADAPAVLPVRHGSVEVRLSAGEAVLLEPAPD